MTKSDSTSGEKGLYATFALAVLTVALLGSALFRPRTARSPIPDLPHENVLLLDEPVEPGRPSQSLPPSQ